MTTAPYLGVVGELVERIRRTDPVLGAGATAATMVSSPHRPVGGPSCRAADAVACPLTAMPESVRAAREFARSTLRGWHATGLWDELSYVVSELVTNAYRHGVAVGNRGCGRPELTLRLSRASSHVICAVQDPSDRVPVRRTPDFVSESGRGLHLVDSLSTMWGSTPLEPGGKAVWALFTL